MSSETTDEPPDRSPEELAAVLADLAAEAAGPTGPDGQPLWKPVGDTAPDIWAVAPPPERRRAESRDNPGEPAADPLTRLDREVTRMERRTPASPPRSQLRVVRDQNEDGQPSEPVAFRPVAGPPGQLMRSAPAGSQPPPLERVGSVPDAWSTLRADRPAAGRQPPRARLLSGVAAAAKKFGAHRRDTGPG